MSGELLILIGTAASIGFFHTLLGPDHYLPFIAMSRSGQWSLRKTTLVTTLCGLGHVLSSVLLGFIGVALGLGVSVLEIVESFRGDIAAWALLTFGLVYFVWGLRKAYRNKAHQHAHLHASGTEHVHMHTHSDGHVHVHNEKSSSSSPWILFIIFILGPCEPLIPILMYPAAKNNFSALWIVTGIFAVITIITMLGVVLTAGYGMNMIPTRKLGRYSHAIAGAILSFCGISIIFLGL